MKTSSIFFAITALAFVASAHAVAAPAAAPSQLLTQGFDDAGALGGWLLINQSNPAGQTWFQGNSGIFSAQSGAADSYLAANFLSAQNGSGTIDNWLITPEMSLTGPLQLSFYTRSAGNRGFTDTLEVRFGNGSAANTTTFSQNLVTIGGGTAYPDTWQRYTATVLGTGSGRFAFRYTGSGAGNDYIGLDSFRVAVVPEPSTYVLFGAGLGLLGLVRRRARRTLAAGLALATLGAVQPATAAQQGVIAVRDAETGELRAPTAAEAKALQALEQQRQQGQGKSAAPQISRKADGTRKGHLGNQGAVYSVLTRNPDGSSQVDCITGPDAAKDAVTATRATQKGEHRHAND
jgi:hypothetical protein